MSKDVFDEEEIDPDEEEASYEAFLFDAYEDEDYDGYDLLEHDDERIINWDHDEYDFIEDVADPIYEQKYFEN